MKERGWNMRCGQLIYLRGRPDIRFVELRFKSAHSRRTGIYRQRQTAGRTCEREATTWNESAQHVDPLTRLSLHRHESRGGPYWPLKKRRFSLQQEVTSGLEVYRKPRPCATSNLYDYFYQMIEIYRENERRIDERAHLRFLNNYR